MFTAFDAETVELARIASHLVFIASSALDIAGWTAWAYCFRDRERILDMFEMAAGSRLTVNIMRIGGISGFYFGFANGGPAIHRSRQTTNTDQSNWLKW